MAGPKCGDSVAVGSGVLNREGAVVAERASEAELRELQKLHRELEGAVRLLRFLHRLLVIGHRVVELAAHRGGGPHHRSGVVVQPGQPLLASIGKGSKGRHIVAARLTEQG